MKRIPSDPRAHVSSHLFLAENCYKIINSPPFSSQKLCDFVILMEVNGIKIEQLGKSD